MAFDGRLYNEKHATDHAALQFMGWWPASITADPKTPEGVAQIVAWQKANRLDADGAMGPSAWDVLRRQHRPEWGNIPRGPKEIEACYGNPVKGMGAKGQPVADPKWAAANIVGANLGNGKVRQFHKLAAAEFAWLFEVAARISGYLPKSVQTWVVRFMRGGDRDPSDPPRLSTHSYGCAFDVDPADNPWGGGPGTPLVDHPLFAAVFRVAGWSCGIDWRKSDNMHFQRSRS